MDQTTRRQRLLVTGLLGFSSSLPLPLVLGTLVAWMRDVHVDLKTIGIYSLVQAPYTVKYLWAPLLDRYSLPFLNRRTGWMFVAQAGLVLSICAMGLCDPVRDPWWMALFAFITAFLSASQDIVIDAYRTELLPEKELGDGAGITVLGLRIALLVAGAGALTMSDHTSWKKVYFIMAALMSVGLVTSIFAPEPEARVTPPRRISEAVIQPFISFFRSRGWTAVLLLLFIVFYKFGDAMASIMSTPCLLDLGFTKTDIGLVNKGLGMVCSIVGALIGGRVVSRVGLMPSLWIFGFTQAGSNLAFSVVALAGHHYPTMVAAIGIENLCSGMGMAAFLAYLMSITDKKYSGTQYALFTSIMALGRTLAGVPSGFMAEGLGWPFYFVVCTFLATPGLVILWAIGRFVSARRPAATY